MNDEPKLSRRRRAIAQLFLPAIGLTWIVSVAVGFGGLFNYQTDPGQIGAVPVKLPPESQIETDSHQSTLIMFAHPRCPCTRASVSELARVMAKSQKRVRAYVVFRLRTTLGLQILAREKRRRLERASVTWP